MVRRGGHCGTHLVFAVAKDEDGEQKSEEDAATLNSERHGAQ